MTAERNTPFEIQPLFSPALPEVASFLYKWYRSQEGGPAKSNRLSREPVAGIERRLEWLLVKNPAVTDGPLGYCLRDEAGAIRGLTLCFPIPFVLAGQRLLGLCSGTFLVETAARLMGFFLLKKCLNMPGYAFNFASTCNSQSSPLWRGIGAEAIPRSEMEYILPIRLDAVIAAYVAYRTSNRSVARLARVCGRGANPILRFLRRSAAKYQIEPCEDWEKLSALSRRHCLPSYVTADRSPAFLQWRYGPGSPACPGSLYVVRDEQGNEGWFALGHLIRGETNQFRATVLLDAIWPRGQMSFRDVFEQILRVAAVASDAISFRWQPGLDSNEFGPCVIPRNLGAPRAFVRPVKGGPAISPAMFDYDDSDYIAWTF